MTERAAGPLDRFFALTENGTNARTELLAGLTTFLTMAYIIFVQPAVLSGQLTGGDTGLDFGAVTTATCLAAALATAIMGLYARYPVAQAPGMGQNFMFVSMVAIIAAGQEAGTIAAGTTAWQVALGVIFISGVLFLLLSLLGVREMLLEALSPSMRAGIAIGIGMFIAFIGLRNAGVIVIAEDGPELNPRILSPDLVVFLFALFATAGLFARGVRGAIVLGILAAAVLSAALKWGLPHVASVAASPLVTESMLMTRFTLAEGLFSAPPSLEPTLLKMDLVNALARSMIPFILIFLFMDVFDTLGTLVGVTEQAGLMKDGKLPRARQAMLSDAIGTVAGAALGTSTVTSYIESASGVEQGGRTGLTALTVAALFLLAPFFSPLIAMVGSYPPITAAALVIVGSLMMRNVTSIAWTNPAEALPAFLVILGIPLTYSIADGLALGFIAYPVVKLLGGQGSEVRWLNYLLAALLLAYFVFVRMPLA